ncbi:MAG: NAD-dependent deacylase [bacterium]
MDFDKKLLSIIKAAKNVVFFTGAGISAESGIPTFRGKDGIWNKLRPEELANFNAFLKNPDLVWEWYQLRKKIIDENRPNPGHLAIAQSENIFENVTVITQNVDNLHRRAGSKNVLELHGNIEKNYCIKCKKRYDDLKTTNDKKAHKCTICGGLIRPDIVWFGEMLPQDVFDDSEKAAKKCDVCFVVGTSAVVFPAANIPILAKRYGAVIVEINIEKTDMTAFAHYSLFGTSGIILPELLKQVKEM